MFFKRLAQQSKFHGMRIIGKVEAWTKPRKESLVVGTIADMPRSKGELIAENALLGQQVIILLRQVKHPQVTQPDRR